MDHTEITCQQFIRALADYLAGDLTPDEMGSSEMHLAVCPECVSYLKNYEITIRLGADAFRAGGDPGAAETDALPEGFADVILTARPRK